MRGLEHVLYKKDDWFEKRFDVALLWLLYLSLNQHINVIYTMVLLEFEKFEKWVPRLRRIFNELFLTRQRKVFSYKKILSSSGV